MLITQRIDGNMHEACATVNKLSLSRFVLQMEEGCGDYTIMVFRTDCYPDTCHVLEKLGRPPITTKMWMDGVLTDE